MLRFALRLHLVQTKPNSLMMVGIDLRDSIYNKLLASTGYLFVTFPQSGKFATKTEMLKIHWVANIA